MKVFIISGKARHGKDTIANFIKNYYHEKEIGKPCIMHLSSHIKDYAREYFGWDGNDSTKPRTLLQELGTNIIREKLGKEMFHLNRTIEDIEILNEYFDIFIVSDIRLPLEIETFKNRFDTISIHVIRPNFENELNNKENKHITETALNNYKNYDYVINNDGTLDDLKVKVYEMLEEVK